MLFIWIFGGEVWVFNYPPNVHIGGISRGRVMAVVVSIIDRCQLTDDSWHVTGDMWHMSYDTWCFFFSFLFVCFFPFLSLAVCFRPFFLVYVLFCGELVVFGFGGGSLWNWFCGGKKWENYVAHFTLHKLVYNWYVSQSLSSSTLPLSQESVFNSSHFFLPLALSYCL